MATMTATKPVQEQPAVDEAGRNWHDRVMSAHGVITKPSAVFVQPPESTTVADLRAVRIEIDPHSANPGSLLHFMLPRDLLLQSVTGKTYAMQRVVGDTTAPDVLAGRLAGEHKREQMAELLQDFLNAVDNEVVERLHEGQGRDVLISTGDFDVNFQASAQGRVYTDSYTDSLRHVWAAENAIWLQGVVFSAFPKDSPVRKWPQEFLYLDPEDRVPLVILGRQKPSWSTSAQGQPRAFYSLKHAEYLTRGFRVAQLQRLVERPVEVGRAKEYTDAAAIIDRLGGTLPKRLRDEPAPAPRAGSSKPWRQSVLDAIEIFMHPQRRLVKPPAGTPLDLLLSVRAAFSVNEEALDPNRGAALNFASQHAGNQRSDELADLLHNLLAGLDKLFSQRLEDGFLWAAQQAEKS